VRHLKSACAVAALVLGATAPVIAAPPQAAPAAEAAAQSPYVLEEVMVPMRDGAKLQTVILRPRNQAGPLPLLFSRTPYGIATTAPKSVPKSWAALDKDGYIYVSQSMRGRFTSDGVFTLSTAVHPNDPKAVDEATDAWDSIDWLVKNVPNNNGKVGMKGISYPGFAAAVALTNPHPALKAVSPQAAWIDYWMSDDLHRNGALRLSYATDWISSLQVDKTDNKAFDYDSYDTYDWFLKIGPVENIDKLHFKGKVPMFTALLDHPDHDGFYTDQRWSDSLGKTTVPTLNVAGYWDQEDPWGSWQIYFKQAKNDPDHLATMVAGPWSHGYWSLPTADNLGPIQYGVPSGQQFLETVEAPFFAYWLHGKGKRPDAGVKSFQSGSWTWHDYKAWPPAGGKTTALFLRADGSLSFTAPAAGEACRDYVSDPANPVPFRQRPMSGTYLSPDWQWWEAADQRFLGGRPDILSYMSDPLPANLTVTGSVAAKLMASTSGTDSDFVVKLIDVYPDNYAKNPDQLQPGDYAKSLNGYQLPVAMDVRRGRFLASDTAPQALVPNKVVAWDVPLREHDHVFLKGHRLMVQVQSSWFPMIDRNPQKFVPNIMRAKASDFVKATQKVCAGSKIELPVM
jgi:putative CocE/NonD family hydrolase